MTRNVVVFSGNLTYSVRKGIVEIDRAIPGLNWLIVLHEPEKSFRQLLRSQWRNLRRNGWRWIPYQASDIVERIRSRVVKPGKSPGNEYSMQALENRTNLKLLKVSDIHGEQTLGRVSDFSPELGISLAAPILKRSLFSIPRLGTVNLHKGEVPDYRGMPPAFWELWNDEQSVGCTVHWVDEKLDTGSIVAETRIKREQYSTLTGMQLQLDEVGVTLMRQAVVAVMRGENRSTPQGDGGRTYPKPTLAQVSMLRRKLQPRQSLSLKRIIKNRLASAIFVLWRFGLYRFVAPRVTVLLYHRVSDSVRDNLTVGVEQFDRHMALIRKFCQPIALETLMSGAPLKKSRKPVVCVTFDDGYEDNYTHAAQILLRHDIPAAFFVSTGIIESKGRFPHDVRRGNPQIPVMNWTQLREMRDWGFQIGSHTVSHIDCAGEPEEVVWDELTRSRKKLQDELALEHVVLAYPYGGREHMNPERLELVKKAGYTGCISAYGGVNVTCADNFNVLRRGIHWEFSDQAFLLECIGL